MIRPARYLDGDDNERKKTKLGPSPQPAPQRTSSYNLGIGKNKPVTRDSSQNTTTSKGMPSNMHWNVSEPVEKSISPHQGLESLLAEEDLPSRAPKSKALRDGAAAAAAAIKSTGSFHKVRKMVAKTQEDASLRGAIWHEEHYADDANTLASKGTYCLDASIPLATNSREAVNGGGEYEALSPKPPKLFYPDIDLSIPDEVYSDDYDAVWDLIRWEAFQEAKREPLLVSFLYSSILNHKCLESSLAFLLANRLSSPAMISTQIQSLIMNALETDETIGRKLRADIMAVRDRDPACTCLPDVFLYFKGFHALQTYRVANVLWKSGKQVLAHYLQSQMSQTFQIDIHPNATLGSGIMLDHGTGIVVGETARIGHNCSILHHVTLGGSGKKGVDRHPKVGNGVLLGAGASVLGNVIIGDGCQVGAGTLVITDLPPHSVAVGVPAKIIGSFVDVTEQPSIGMNQMMDEKIVTFQSDGI